MGSKNSNVSGALGKAHEFFLKWEKAGGTDDLLQEIIDSPGNLKARRMVGFLKNDENPFLIPQVPNDPIQAWKVLYEHFFGVELETSSIQLPAEKEGFDQLIIVAKDLKTEQVYQKIAELFTCSKYTYSSLDKMVTENDRVPALTYAVRLRSRTEADEEFANQSADQLKEANHTGITLLERLLLELYHYWTTGEHLDTQNITLCSGSRYSDGRVPCVDWGGDRLEVGWSLPSHAGSRLRSREVVSA